MGGGLHCNFLLGPSPFAFSSVYDRLRLSPSSLFLNKVHRQFTSFNVSPTVSPFRPHVLSKNYRKWDGEDMKGCFFLVWRAVA
ncbi:hypothetical protein K2173_014584 [Erythroxylum novogranatense]|uniref:Uncharacterized protein n=1 Tax=Erythroxylum novogranatense TaxID=1862640 RepID=A0AAV8TF17_9ROSI|nr:hypothetical protein K2173_014584 [Erythroxylum novogranatense]